MCTTVVEVTKNIHDTVLMPHDSQCQNQPQDILNNVIFAFKMSLLSE